MDDCIFCKIVVGDVPAEKIYEDEEVVAFLDISPITKGHTLVIPKQHFKDLLDTPDDSLAKLMSVVKNIAPSITRAMGADGFNVGLNNGKAAGQVVYHIHFHIIPRFTYDNLKMWEGSGYKEGEMEEVGSKIRSYLNQSK